MTNLHFKLDTIYLAPDALLFLCEWIHSFATLNVYWSYAI